jgi:hypothetical protein
MEILHLVKTIFVLEVVIFLLNDNGNSIVELSFKFYFKYHLRQFKVIQLQALDVAIVKCHIASPTIYATQHKTLDSLNKSIQIPYINANDMSY